MKGDNHTRGTSPDGHVQGIVEGKGDQAFRTLVKMQWPDLDIDYGGGWDSDGVYRSGLGIPQPTGPGSVPMKGYTSQTFGKPSGDPMGGKSS
jgi:hypothetical protein